MKKLNLGCGDDYREGWVNADLYAKKVDEQVDLNVLPLPWENNVFDRVVCHQVLEHLTCHPYEFVKEVFRVTKPSGSVIIGLPSFSFTLPHLRGYHPECYMNVVSGYGGSAAREYHWPLGELVVCRRRFSLITFLRHIKEFITAMGSRDVVWEFKKL